MDLIDRLGHLYFVLTQLLQSPLEVDIGGLVKGDPRRGESTISLMIITSSQASPIP